MAKNKANKYAVDYDDYEEKEGGYDGDQPKKGVYDGKLVSLREHTTSDTALEWQFEITEEPYSGWRGWSYTNMEAAKWKTQQYTKAISGGEEKPVTLRPAGEGADGTASRTVKAALPVRIRVVQEDWEDEKRARIRSVVAADAKASKKKSKKGVEDDPYGDDD